MPQIAPMEVAIESANRARSSLEEKPLPSSMCFMSSSEKMPVRRPVPMNVPSVSNVSDIENAKIVTSTSGSFGYVGEQRREAIGAEDHAEGLRQLGERVGDGHGVGHAGQAHRDADDRGDDDGQQHAALELEHGEHDGEQQADQEQPQVGVFSVARPGVAPVARPLPAALVSFGVKVTRLTLSMPT